MSAVSMKSRQRRLAAQGGPRTGAQKWTADREAKLAAMRRALGMVDAQAAEGTQRALDQAMQIEYELHGLQLQRVRPHRLGRRRGVAWRGDAAVSAGRTAHTVAIPCLFR